MLILPTSTLIAEINTVDKYTLQIIQCYGSRDLYTVLLSLALELLISTGSGPATVSGLLSCIYIRLTDIRFIMVPRSSIYSESVETLHTIYFLFLATLSQTS